MKAGKMGRIFLVAVLLLLLAALLLVGAMLARQEVVGRRINNDYAAVVNDPAYQIPVSVGGVSFIRQKISCGYAIIEMLANWQGKVLTEQALYEQNGHTISTAMGTGFLDEMEKQFPNWSVTRHTNLTNAELLATAHEALAADMPVPIEFAALLDTGEGGVWTLHYAVVTAMDLQNDHITVQNPYGYEETYTVEDFLRATRYDNYENMEFYFKLGFAFGLFHKNTIYTIQG